MKIAFDIDGTITTNDTWWIAASKTFGFTREEINKQYSLPVPLEDTLKMIDDNVDLIYGQVSAAPGAREVVSEIAERHEIYYITARNPKHEAITREWMVKHGFSADKDHLIFNRDKAEVCKELGIQVMVEDCAEHTDDLAKENILTFLLKKPYNVDVPTDPHWVVRVNSMKHFRFMFTAAEMIMDPESAKKAGTKK